MTRADGMIKRTTGGVIIALMCIGLICIGLSGCEQRASEDPMQQPMAAASEEQLLESLLSMKQQLAEEDYQRLLQAVDTLRTFDLDALTVEQHLASLDGSSPEQIMAAADELARRQPPAVSQ